MKKPNQPHAPGVPFHVFLTRALDSINKSNVEVAQSLEYPRPNVIAMLRNGTMRVPLSKIAKLADMTGIDRVAMLQMALAEYDPGLLTTLRELMGPQLVTRNELAILEFIRAGTGGLDVDLTADDEFVMALQSLVGKATERLTVGELGISKDSKVRPTSKTTRLNQEMAALLDRQARERGELHQRILREFRAD